jgi:preprotein translocase subunit YajC
MQWAVLIQIGLVAAVLLLGWILLIRPQMHRLAGHNQVLKSLRVGDCVVTRGGLIGVIVAFGEAGVLRLEISTASTVEVLLESIERRFERPQTVGLEDNL